MINDDYQVVDLAVTNQFFDLAAVTNLLLLIFFIAFIAWLVITIANFFPAFIASLTQKYKSKLNVDIDYNRDYNVDHNAKLLKYMFKKEIKKNHGKRLPFRR